MKFRDTLICFFMIFASFVNSSHYKTLGVKKSATDKEIKKAYRTLALKWHPDKAPEKEREEATKQFQKISEAYEVLSDKEQRRQYDMSQENPDPFSAGPRSSGQPRSGPHSNTGWQSGGTGGATSQHFEFSHRSPQDIFKEFFGTDSPFDMMKGMGDQAKGGGGGGGGIQFDILKGMSGGGGGIPTMMNGMGGNPFDQTAGFPPSSMNGRRTPKEKSKKTSSSSTKRSTRDKAKDKTSSKKSSRTKEKKSDQSSSRSKPSKSSRSSSGRASRSTRTSR